MCLGSKWPSTSAVPMCQMSIAGDVEKWCKSGWLFDLLGGIQQRHEVKKMCMGVNPSHTS